MAITRLSTPASMTISYASGPQTNSEIDVPAGAEFAIFAIRLYSTSTGTPSSVTFGGQTAELINVRNGDGAWTVALWYVPIVSAPATDVTMAMTHPFAWDDGGQVHMAFFTGGATASGITSLVRDSDIDDDDVTAVTPELTAQSGDYIIMAAAVDTGTPTPNHGTIVDGTILSFTEYLPTGNTTMGVTGIFPTVVAAVLIPLTNDVTPNAGGVESASVVGELVGEGRPAPPYTLTRVTG